jgi:hypothetical protein
MFFVCIFENRVEYGFLPPVDGTVNSMEQKTLVFCQIDVQEFHVGVHSDTKGLGGMVIYFLIALSRCLVIGLCYTRP